MFVSRLRYDATGNEARLRENAVARIAANRISNAITEGEHEELARTVLDAFFGRHLHTVCR